MHATPLSAEVTLLGFSKSNPLCSIRGGSYPILHPPSAGKLGREIRQANWRKSREGECKSSRPVSFGDVELPSLARCLECWFR